MSRIRGANMKRFFVALLVSLLLPLAVHGHTPLAASTPADQAAVAAPVKEIALEFGSDVRLTALALADATGARVTVGEVPAAVAAKFTIAVRDELAPGDYVATWRAVGADTHVITGEIHFKVTAPRSH
jgi:methionine-rich copper-binding protein CopC